MLDINIDNPTKPIIKLILNPNTIIMPTRKTNARQALQLQKIKNAIEIYIMALIEKWVLDPEDNEGIEPVNIPYCSTKQVYDDEGKNPKELPDCSFNLLEPQTHLIPKEAIETIKKKVSEQIDKHGHVCVYVCKDNREVTIEEFDEIQAMDHITDKWQDAYESTDIEYPCIVKGYNEFGQGLAVDRLYIAWD